MIVVIRVDASTSIGSGHVVRCITLANALKKKGAEVLFVCRDYVGNASVEIIRQGHACKLLPRPQGYLNRVAHGNSHEHWLGEPWATDLAQTKDVLAGIKVDWLVVDHYGVDFRWESGARSIAEKIFVIDDLADRRHECDALLDQNLVPEAEARYSDITPASCKLFLGPLNALLRQEFEAARQAVRPRAGEIKNVLIFFGGADHNNMTGIAIDALANVAKTTLNVDVVIAADHPFLKQVESACVQYGYICHVQTRRMADLMARADIAIGTGGISTYERLYLRLPAIIKALSFNQVAPLDYMSSIGLFDVFSDRVDLERVLARRLGAENFSPPDCVASGVEKISAFMVDEWVSLRKPLATDLRRTFFWLQNEDLRKSFSIERLPERKVHFQYWRNLLSDEEQRVFSIYFFNKHVGNCGIKNIIYNEACELWIYLAATEARGRGIAKEAVKNMLNVARVNLLCREVYLHVARSNEAAINLYKVVGFAPDPMPLQGRWKGKDAEFMRMVVKL